jgi:hypothetical protein
VPNTATAFGFKHIGFLPGSSPDYQLSTRLIASTNTTAIFFGDPVAKVASTQYIAQQSVTTATVDGIFQGCMLIPSTGGAPTWSPFYPGAAGADVTAYVLEAPKALFMAAAFSTNISSTSIGNGISFHTGTGSTVGGGFSGYTLDQATITTATTAPFQVVGLYGAPGNSNFGGVGNGSDSTSAFNWVVVTFNNQRFNSLAGVA